MRGRICISIIAVDIINTELNDHWSFSRSKVIITVSCTINLESVSKEWTTWREYHLKFSFLNLKTFWVKRRTYFERFKWMHKVKTFNLYWIIIIRKVSFEVHTFLSTITQKANAQMNKWERVFMNGPSKICGRQPLKKLKWYGLLKQTMIT